MFSEQAGVFNPAIHSQEYFEQVLKVVYPHVKVKAIVPFSKHQFQAVSSDNKIYYGFATVAMIDPESKNAYVQFEQRGSYFQAIQGCQYLALFDGTDVQIGFVGWMADVETPAVQTDTVTPGYTGELKARILKVINPQANCYALVQGLETGIVASIGGVLSEPSQSLIDWVWLEDFSLADLNATHALKVQKGSFSRDLGFVNFGGAIRPFNYSISADGTSINVELVANKVLPDLFELCGLKLKFTDNSNTNHLTVNINNPSSLEDGTQKTIDFSALPFGAGKRLEFIVGYHYNGTYYEHGFPYILNLQTLAFS